MLQEADVMGVSANTSRIDDRRARMAQTLEVHIDRVIDIARFGDFLSLLEEGSSLRGRLVICLRHTFPPDLFSRNNDKSAYSSLRPDFVNN